MKRGLVPLLAAMAAVLLLPAPAAADRFGAYVSCHPAGAAKARSCSLRARPVAVFRAFRRRGVRYKVCVRRPSGRVKCRRRRTGPRGARSRTAIRLARPGRHTVTWWIGSARIDRDRLRARAPRVFVNGDSLAVGTRPYIPPALRGWPVAQSTSISRHAPEGVGILRAKGRGLAGVVVMSLGTNDDPHATDEFRSAIRATMRIAGSRRCVVWPNIVRPAVGGKTYAEYNAILARENRRWDNLRVVDWAEMVRENRGWMYSDGVHPNAEGYEARARAIARKVRACVLG